MAISRAYTLRPPNPYHDAGQVMADVYASAVGTTVLQVKEIPPRPARFDGAICLFGLQAAVSEAAVRKALGQCGQIVGCELDRDPAVVRFSTHDAALKAKAEYSEGVPDLFSGLDMQYNERSYNGRRDEHERANDNGRGWCAPCTPRMTQSHRETCPVVPSTALTQFLPPTQVLLRERRERRAVCTVVRVPQDEGALGHAASKASEAGRIRIVTRARRIRIVTRARRIRITHA